MDATLHTHPQGLTLINSPTEALSFASLTKHFFTKSTNSADHSEEERRNTAHTNRLHHHCCSEAIKRILPLCQLNHRNAKRPHVTLQPCLILEDLRSIIPQHFPLIPPFGAGVLHLFCQAKVAQLDQASFRKEQIVGFDVLSIHPLFRHLHDE